MLNSMALSVYQNLSTGKQLIQIETPSRSLAPSYPLTYCQAAVFALLYYGLGMRPPVKLLALRIYWAIALLLLLWCALSVLSAMIMRFLESPTHLISTDSGSTTIEFPSVLVCPEISFPQWKIEQLLANTKYPSGMSAAFIRPIIRQIAAFFSPDVKYHMPELSTVQQYLEYNGMDVEEAGALLTTTCNETFIRCRFESLNMDCAEIFHMEIALYGFCCVFNGRSLKMNMDKSNGTEEQKEWMATGVGPFASLMMAINQTQVLNTIDLSYKWLAIDSSQHYVEAMNNGTPLTPGSEQWFSIWSEPLEIKDDSSFMSDSLRGCRINNKPLKYFHIYNKSYCLLECRVKQLLRRCHCALPVYRPFGARLCRTLSLPCAWKTMMVFDVNTCDCPHTCQFYFDMVDSSEYVFSPAARPLDSFYEGLNLLNVTVARVYVRSRETRTYVRHPYFNVIDLFSQLGGVFNVFFGCSILTLLELLQLALYSYRHPAPKTKLQKFTTFPKKTTISMKKKKNTTSTFFSLCLRKRGCVKKTTKAPKKKVMFKLKKNNGLQLFYSY